MPLNRIVVVEPSGFCAGVKRAVGMLEQALCELAPPIYCYRELVHNRQVIEQFTARGVRFVNCLDEVPEGANLVFSAHGVAPQIVEQARGRCLRVLDATCPFVARIHSKVRQFVAEGRTVFLVGHRTHDEVRGVVGEAPGAVMVIENPAEAEAVQVAPGTALAVVTQTTLSVADTAKTIGVLHSRFPALATLPQSDICLAVRNRQLGVSRLAEQVQRILVLGAQNSSNSQRLVEVAVAAGADATLISTLDDLADIDWQGVDQVGITAGASTPESFMQAVINALRRLNGAAVTRLRVATEDLAAAEPSLAEGDDNGQQRK
ncbi:MAG: 4-hydroxy-3-methylbut-2-enyl diphosphate reductase [Oligosphaeraceae bacterium]|nr:4-hydroxy-3-methylbut-2-enyl diphosphate reductase [Oligosphaeraceae bacterium]